MNTFVSILRTIKIDNGSEEFKQANSVHADYYKALIPEEKFLMSGPSLNEDGQFDGGIFIIRAKDRAEANDIMSHDPLVVAGFASFDLMEFKPMLANPILKKILDKE